MAQPDKTQLLNSYVAHSMNTWAKATIDQEHLRERRRGRALSVDEPLSNNSATSRDLPNENLR